jgi:acyl-CoA dehydrogenase family protein 9
MKEDGFGKLSQMVYAIKTILKRDKWPMNFRDSLMKDALKIAKRNARSIRKMLLLGILIHGKNLPQKEFLLRRITRLSFYLFGLTCMLAYLNCCEMEGHDVTDQKKMLSYFLEEAKSARKINNRFSKSKKEKLHHEIFEMIAPEKSK